MSELPPVSVYVARIEEMQTEIERMRNTLIVFSDPHSWRRNGVCDPNSANFRGQQIANDALSRSPPGPLSKGDAFRSWWERGLPRSPSFYGAECPSYPNCSGGCGLGCTHEIESREPCTAAGNPGFRRE